MCDVIGIYGRWAWMREEKNRFCDYSSKTLSSSIFLAQSFMVINSIASYFTAIDQMTPMCEKCSLNWGIMATATFHFNRNTLCCWAHEKLSEFENVFIISHDADDIPFTIFKGAPVSLPLSEAGFKANDDDDEIRIESASRRTVFAHYEFAKNYEHAIVSAVEREWDLSHGTRRYFVFLRFLDPKIVHCWKAWSTHDVRRRAASEISRNCLSFLIRFNETRHLWWFVFFHHFARPLSGFFLADWKGRVEKIADIEFMMSSHSRDVDGITI